MQRRITIGLETMTLRQGADSLCWCRAVSKLLDGGAPLETAMKKGRKLVHGREVSLNVAPPLHRLLDASAPSKLRSMPVARLARA